jgi:glycosyltransferase involved in cell wall biosynthesis
VFEDTVRSFLDSATRGIEHELLLIDNNSTDATREIGERIAARDGDRVRYMNEPSQGHPLAKNRGVRESRGEIIAFVDDDLLFAPGWLSALEAAFERHLGIACVGGKVLPRFEGERPAWLLEEMLWIYGVTHYGDEAKEIRFPDVPIGCNMAFRRSVFERIGTFHGALGRKPGSLLSGDEDHFLLRAERAGLTTLYAPNMVVFHRIPPARMTRDWVLRRFYWGGISDVAKRQRGDDPVSRRMLVRQSVAILHGLLRRWRETARVLSAIRAGGDGYPVVRQALLLETLGTLRQSAVEAFLPRRG